MKEDFKEIPFGHITSWEEAWDYLKNNYDFSVSEETQKLLQKYYETLIDWNSRFNLTRLTDLDKFLTSHLLDTASLIIPIRNLNLNKNPDYLDVGSGCGVPGIILHSFFPSKTFLCESITKKCKFLEAAIFEVGLKGQVKILNYRSEALGENKDFKNKFNLITARAVAKPNEILLSLEPLLKRGGYFLGQFGEDYELASDTRHLKARDKYFYTTADGRKKYIIVFERC